MAGALDALKVGSAMTDLDGYIIGCCPHFAGFVGRRTEEVLGRQGREFLCPTDTATAIRFLEVLWRTGESFTIIARLMRPDGTGALYESHVSRLTTPMGAVALSVARPFRCSIRATEPDAEMAAAKASYVASMGLQFADFAADAFMPVTCDLFRVAALAAAREGGLGNPSRTGLEA